jgi:hypothetical protein
MDENFQRRMEQFLDNHWIHMERRVSRLEGKVYLLVGISSVTLAGIVALLTKAW